MRHTRRDLLRKASALSALALGASSTAAAHSGHCDAPDWDSSATYSGGDQVVYDGALWTAEWWTQREPDADLGAWTREHDCDEENEEPTASFTMDGRSPAPGETVSFDASASSDADGSIASYEWDFDDGDSATGETVTHSFDAEGEYTVTLIVRDDEEAPATATKTVAVGEGSNVAPDASFTVDPTEPDTGETVSFDAAGSSDSDGSLASFEWDFGDGATATGESVTHTYETADDYTVSLTVTDDDGASDSNDTTVTVSGTGSGGGSCDGVDAWDADATYTGGDQVTYDGDLWEASWWTSGDEPGSSEYGPWENEGACGDTNEAPTASFTTDASAPAPGEDITFDAGDSSDADGSIASYEWDFGDGSTATGEVATHGYADAGDYTVTLTVSDDAGATDSASTTVSISDADNPTQITIDSSIDGWLGAEPAAIEGERNPTISLTSGESYAFTYNNVDGIPHDLVIRNAAGEELLATERVGQEGQSRTLEFEATEEMVEYICTVHPKSMVGDLAIDGNAPPMAGLTVDTANPDPGQEVSFDAGDSSDADGSIASYEWDFGDGSTATGETVSHTYAEAGEYTVELTVTDDGGASAVTSTDITVGSVNEEPTASFSVDPASPAPGEQASFDASESSDPDGSIASYEWAFGDDSTATGETASHTYAEAGSYSVELTVTDDGGATGATTTTVQVGDGSDVTAETTLEEFFPAYDEDFNPEYAEGGVQGLLKNELNGDASEYGADVDAIQNNAGDGSMQLGALGDRGLELVKQFDAAGVPRENNARIMPWVVGLPEETEPIPFNDGGGRDGGLTADAGPVAANNDPSVLVQDAWPSGEQFDDDYLQPDRVEWSSGVSDSQYNNTDNPIIEATTEKVHPVSGESLGDGFTANAPVEATAELHGDGWLFNTSLIFENLTEVPLLIDGAIMWYVAPSKEATGLDQFSYDNAQRKNFSVGHPQRDVIEVALPDGAKPGPFEGTDAPLSAYGIRVTHHDNPYMYRVLYPNQKFSMTYGNVTGPSQYDWPVDDLVDVMLDTLHLEFRTQMDDLEQNTELVDALDMRNRYGN
ncbi:PKD domain-containing protein [Halomicrobium katesii]|uniref:PKD domain-containing protein n=1 Tax=Halomicrobium katesii TaxID=437163 RepID=UPI000382F29B|nr:PKD domain-containing protein [Halomicrobium katesii]